MQVDLNIPERRLRNQHLSAHPFTRPEEAVRWLVAVQAQDYYGAKWSLALRLRGATDQSIEQAINAGEVLRTHLLRPTWHFVTPQDIRWLLQLTAPRVHAVNAHRYRQLELDDVLLGRTDDLLAHAVAGGRYRTRQELGELLAAAGIPAVTGQRLAYIVMHAELEAVLCSGPRQGKQFTYALLDERAPASNAHAPAEPLVELARRYLASHGPATAYDFSKWSGLKVTEARQGLAALSDEFDRATIDGHEYWYASQKPPAGIDQQRVYLLSIYDEYISGYKNYDAIIESELAKKLWDMGNALYYIVVLDGQVVGAWRRTIGKSSVDIEFDLFRELSGADRQALSAAARKYGDFLGLPTTESLL